MQGSDHGRRPSREHIYQPTLFSSRAESPRGRPEAVALNLERHPKQGSSVGQRHELRHGTRKDQGSEHLEPEIRVGLQTDKARRRQDVKYPSKQLLFDLASVLKAKGTATS